MDIHTQQLAQFWVPLGAALCTSYLPNWGAGGGLSAPFPSLLSPLHITRQPQQRVSAARPALISKSGPRWAFVLSGCQFCSVYMLAKLPCRFASKESCWIINLSSHTDRDFKSKRFQTEHCSPMQELLTSINWLVLFSYKSLITLKKNQQEPVWWFQASSLPSNY